MDIQTRYNTDDVAPQDRFAYWRESVCDSYVQLGCDTENRSNFRGLIDIARHSVVSISKVSGLSHTVERRKRDIRATTDSYFLLSLQTAESSQVTQFGKTAVLNPGDMALYSSTDPYTLKLSDDFSKTVVQLPSAKLIERLPNAEMLTARKIDGQSGIGKLVRENILAFAEHVNTANPMVQSLLQDTLIDLIATGLASHGADKIELSSPEQHVMLRAKSYIRAHLGEPGLDRNMVAAQIGMSVRRLNDIFSKEDTSISAFIRKTRLDAVASDLRDARFQRLSISEIAFRHGFSNLQNFSTIFRTRFGQSPRSYRA
ncbi:helix-turn-helix domain-containing protein [Yoonia sp. SS1-5]|uniref:Helix-turn-helix domain-containing protein n=1 Tax=Yoonia rhodophyticola TaxID=3137370 RepID=A0AAN0NIZ9_9RHOB